MRKAMFAGGLIGLMICLIVAAPTTAVSGSLALTTPPITPTVMVVPTYQMGATPTPFLIDEAEADASCIPLSEDAMIFPERYFSQPSDLLRESMVSYFNAGGSLEGVEEALRQQLVEFYEFRMPYLWQIVEQDITGDDIPEIFIAITVPDAPNYGTVYLFMFTCEGDHYEAETLRALGEEGLYEGGGARVISLADLNDNGYREILFSVSLLWSFLDPEVEFVEYHLLEWREGDWTPLWQEIDQLGEVHYHITGEQIGGLEIVDQDDDSVYEIVIDGQVYRWDGEMYILDEEE